MYFQYDNKGVPLGFILNGVQYFYITNQMGDVIAVTESNGDMICEYIYNEWGELIDKNLDGAMGRPEQIAVANANPLRYRGYYYDAETGYYYLQSRYYDPSICRFINADIPEIAQISKDIPVGTNIFAYCNNDPVNNSDPIGKAMINIVLSAIFAIVGVIFGKWLANKLLNPKTTKNYKLKYYAIIAGSTAVGAIVGWFAGSLLTKLVIAYLRSHPVVYFKMIAKYGASSSAKLMRFLGVNPFAYLNAGTLISLLQQYLSRPSLKLSIDLVKLIYSACQKLNLKITVDSGHPGTSWNSYHMHIGKVRVHIALLKSAYDWLKARL